MPAARGNTNSLTVDQLTRELKLRNVTLPKSSIRKEVLVDLYNKHVLSESNTNSTDVYSSDDDDIQQPILDNNDSYVNNQEMTEADILNLSDTDLRAKLKLYDENIGPITNTTRSIYRKKLGKFIRGELLSSNLNTTSVPVVTTYSDDEQDDAEDDRSHVSTHDVSIQNDLEDQENGVSQLEEEINKRNSRMREQVMTKEVIETRYTRAVHNSVHPASSPWTRRYEDDNLSSGSSMLKKPLVTRHNVAQEENIRKGGIYDDVYASKGQISTPKTDFHRRSMTLLGLTPRPPISTYSPSRMTPGSTYLHDSNDSDVRHRVRIGGHTPVLSKSEKTSQKSSSCFSRLVMVAFIILILSVFGYVVYLNVEPAYFPKLN